MTSLDVLNLGTRMNTVDLVILACTIANPGVCREFHIQFESPGSLRYCMRQAPDFFGQWAEEHPDQQIRSWRCVWPDLQDRKT